MHQEKTKFGEIGGDELDDDEDQWVEQKTTNVMEMPVKESDDKCDIIEINARMYEVRQYYLDQVIKNIQQ